MEQIPHLVSENGTSTLYVNGEPYLALGGEIHNSSASNPAYMQEKVWPEVRKLNLNTIIAPVYWELIEPEQGTFDFSLVEGLIEQARAEKIHLVLLWFGLWKNGKSSYVPSWVKRDYITYFRACYADGSPSDTISPLSEAAVTADAAAFKRLMAFLKAFDEGTHTVIMMQVENEIGLLGSERDYSAAANAGFEAAVPTQLAEAYGVQGSWEQAFGADAGEWFMAYHYALAVERIASAGSESYPLPMFVNAWLEQYPWRAGTYPSGGPVAKVMKMWKLAAPTLCLYAPDIYLSSFADVCQEYTQEGNPLFIPEARRDVSSAANVFYAMGKHDALGFAPFGVEGFFPEEAASGGPDFSIMMALNIDFSGFVVNGTGPYLAQSYKLLGGMLGLIQQNRGTGKMTGFLQQNDGGCILPFSRYDVKLSYKRPAEGTPPAGGLVIELSEDRFIFAGIGFSVELLPKQGERAKVGLIRVEEGAFEQNEWVRGRVLNGDESAYRIAVGDYASALYIEAYTYK
ncbi:hypothetical protein BBD42_04120 [Paenibacillus sp. BIHB 4019]|uniref:Glycoside hydrolase n=1 Tax=Paenibacillus sp. BIHB 4019 TaxID=1870819 RepID=A0A1B2DDG8_9BACL|nr:DUF5597 domain-containing protein [Paenibacillus sp. BIHB 4019]ANY65740.1 hypothetical protein BBD42_04120 [Paenibacillus sp. BIHB 4019]